MLSREAARPTKHNRQQRRCAVSPCLVHAKSTMHPACVGSIYILRLTSFFINRCGNCCCCLVAMIDQKRFASMLKHTWHTPLYTAYPALYRLKKNTTDYRSTRHFVAAAVAPAVPASQKGCSSTQFDATVYSSIAHGYRNQNYSTSRFRRCLVPVFHKVHRPLLGELLGPSHVQYMQTPRPDACYTPEKKLGLQRVQQTMNDIGRAKPSHQFTYSHTSLPLQWTADDDDLYGID